MIISFPKGAAANHPLPPRRRDKNGSPTDGQKGNAMATKKTVTKVESEEQEQLLEQQAEEKETVKDAWDEEVPVVVPRKPKGADQQFYVCVNDRRFTVPANGKQQMLPKPVAEILQAAIEAEYEAEEFADNIPNESGDDPRNHAI